MDVTETLKKEQSQYPSVNVDREDNLSYDLGNLLAFDPKPLDIKAYKENHQKCLHETARDNMQLLINKLFELPVTKPEEGVNGMLAELPAPTYVVPREKPVPKVRAETKWEKFAQEKGITKRKRERMVLDENTGEYRPRWGYKRANDANDEWIIEAKNNDDPNIDPFAKKIKQKKEHIALQKKQERLNLRRGGRSDGAELKLPSTISVTNNIMEPIGDKKAHLADSFKIAQKATISLGKFDRRVEGERPVKERKKFETLHMNEKEKNMKVLDRILRKTDKGSYDMTKAVNQTITEHQKKRSLENMEERAKGKKRRK